MYKFYSGIFAFCLFFPIVLCAQDEPDLAFINQDTGAIEYGKLEAKIAQLTSQVERLIQLQEPKQRPLIKTLIDFISFLKEALGFGVSVVVLMVSGRVILTLYNLYSKVADIVNKGMCGYKTYVIDKIPQKIRDFYFAHQDTQFI